MNKKYHQLIKTISNQLVLTQAPIRILDAIQWTPEIKERFFKKKFKELPQVHEVYYQNKTLGFSPDLLSQEFKAIEQNIKTKLGTKDRAGKMMTHMCHEYRQAIEMLQCRGTHHFSKIARALYGTTSDSLYKNQPSLADLGNSLVEALSNLESKVTVKEEPKNMTDTEVVKI